MTQKKIKGILGKLLRWLVPLLISLLAIWLVLRDIDFSRLADNFTQIKWQTYLFASLAYFASYFLRVFCWYILLRKKVPFRDAFFTMGAGYLLNNVFPFRLGEIGRALLLDDPKGPTALEVLSSVIVERVFDVFLAAVFILSTLPKVIDGVYDKTIILIALIAAVMGLTILYLAARFRTRIIMWITRWGERSKFVKTRIAPRITQVLEGFSVLNNTGSFLLAFFSLSLSWFFAFGENFIVFRSLYPQPPFWWMIFVLSAGTFGAALPSAPASLGIFEGVMVAAFALLGVDAELAFTHAVVIHALTFVYANIMGFIGLRLRGQALNTLYRRAIHRSPEVTPSE
jgi:hypothetical protein